MGADSAASHDEASARRIALVTGAAGDIGRAVAMRLAGDGIAVVLADHEAAADRLDDTQRRCAAMTGASATTTTFDVTDAGSVRDALTAVASEYGTPDLLVNNAGYQGRFANVVDVPLDDAARVLDVNVMGVLTVLQAFAAQLREEGRGGAIVNTASMAGVAGAPNMVAYSASKAAVIALTKSAAKDLAGDGIRVNAVSPAFIGPGAMWDNQVARQAEVASAYYGDDPATVARQMIDQIPMRRYGSVDEVADVIAFLLSDAASYLTGVNIEIAGGAS